MKEIVNLNKKVILYVVIWLLLIARLRNENKVLLVK